MLTQHGVGAALVAGASAPAAETQLRLRVLRAFRWGAEIVQPGDVVAVPYREARQLMNWGKAELAPEEPAEKPAKPKAKAAAGEPEEA